MSRPSLIMAAPPLTHAASTSAVPASAGVSGGGGGGGGLSITAGARPSLSTPASPAAASALAGSKTAPVSAGIDSHRISISGGGAGGGVGGGGTTRSGSSMSTTRPITPAMLPPVAPPPPKVISDEDAITILQKEPASRDEHEVRSLVPWLQTLKCKVFDGLKPDQLLELAERVQYKFMPPGKTVFAQGEVGDMLYVVLAGAVSVWVYDESKALEEDDQAAQAEQAKADASNAAPKSALDLFAAHKEKDAAAAHAHAQHAHAQAQAQAAAAKASGVAPPSPTAASGGGGGDGSPSTSPIPPVSPTNATAAAAAGGPPALGLRRLPSGLRSSFNPNNNPVSPSGGGAGSSGSASANRRMTHFGGSGGGGGNAFKAQLEQFRAIQQNKEKAEKDAAGGAPTVTSAPLSPLSINVGAAAVAPALAALATPTGASAAAAAAAGGGAAGGKSPRHSIAVFRSGQAGAGAPGIGPGISPRPITPSSGGVATIKEGGSGDSSPATSRSSSAASGLFGGGLTKQQSSTNLDPNATSSTLATTAPAPAPAPVPVPASAVVVKKRPTKAAATAAMRKVADLRASLGGNKPVFGELALLENQARSATVKTEEYCQFLCVEKTDFDMVLSGIYKQEVLAKGKTLGDFELFRRVNDHGMLRKLFGFFKKKSVPANTTVVKQYQSLTTIYFLISGECELSVDVVLPQDPNAVGYAHADNTLLTSRRQVRLGQLVPYQMFGELCIARSKRKPKNGQLPAWAPLRSASGNILSPYAVRSVTKAEFYYCDRDDFIRTLKKESRPYWYRLTDLIETRVRLFDTYHRARVEAVTAPAEGSVTAQMLTPPRLNSIATRQSAPFRAAIDEKRAEGHNLSASLSPQQRARALSKTSAKLDRFSVFGETHAHAHGGAAAVAKIEEERFLSAEPKEFRSRTTNPTATNSVMNSTSNSAALASSGIVRPDSSGVDAGTVTKQLARSASAAAITGSDSSATLRTPRSRSVSPLPGGQSPRLSSPNPAASPSHFASFSGATTAAMRFEDPEHEKAIFAAMERSSAVMNVEETKRRAYEQSKISTRQRNAEREKKWISTVPAQGTERSAAMWKKAEQKEAERLSNLRAQKEAARAEAAARKREAARAEREKLKATQNAADEQQQLKQRQQPTGGITLANGVVVENTRTAADVERERMRDRLAMEEVEREIAYHHARLTGVIVADAVAHEPATIANPSPADRATSAATFQTKLHSASAESIAALIHERLRLLQSHKQQLKSGRPPSTSAAAGGDRPASSLAASKSTTFLTGLDSEPPAMLPAINRTLSASESTPLLSNAAPATPTAVSVRHFDTTTKQYRYRTPNTGGGGDTPEDGEAVDETDAAALRSGEQQQHSHPPHHIHHYGSHLRLQPPHSPALSSSAASSHTAASETDEISAGFTRSQQLRYDRAMPDVLWLEGTAELEPAGVASAIAVASRVLRAARETAAANASASGGVSGGSGRKTPSITRPLSSTVHPTGSPPPASSRPLTQSLQHQQQATSRRRHRAAALASLAAAPEPDPSPARNAADAPNQPPPAPYDFNFGLVQAIATAATQPALTASPTKSSIRSAHASAAAVLFNSNSASMNSARSVSSFGSGLPNQATNGPQPAKVKPKPSLFALRSASHHFAL